MVFKKHTKMVKARRPRRRYHPRKTTTDTVTEVSSGVVSNRRRYLKAEKKWHTVERATTDFTALLNGNLTLLNGITQGDDDFERVGRKIQMTSVTIDIECWKDYAGGTSSAPSFCRGVLFLDKYPNGSAPLISELYDTSTLNYNDGAKRNMTYRDRFKVLSDEIFTLSSSGDQGSMHVVRLHKNINFNTTYIGTADTIAAISNGALYYAMDGDGGEDGHFTLSSKLRYTDS